LTRAHTDVTRGINIFKKIQKIKKNSKNSKKRGADT